MKIRQHIFNLNPITFRPPFTSGEDTEFGGKVDIHVFAGIKVRRDGLEVMIEVGMRAIEAGSGGTTADGKQIIKLDRNKLKLPGRIRGIKSGRYSEQWYQDEDWDVDVFNLGPHEFVKQFKVVGDTFGNDIGRSSVHVSFNPIVFDVEVK